ncbi:hypothetical protein AB0I52_28460 [Streptomyces sp. NPDC050423]|uniref:hypothetical protein n=1 Tax=Streptomyces sp. NPDC050423 TaxID=3155402 RepID=UPI003417D773
MTDRDWYDDSEYQDAVRRAERATRFGWATIAAATGSLGCALVASAVVGIAVVIACYYIVVASHY